MAWQAEQRDRCPGCGNPLAETTDDSRRHLWRVVSQTCAACEHKAAALVNLREDKASTDGLLLHVEPVER